MATIDISRRAFDPRKHYAGVRMQQGRVITDDDWNENERIENEDRRRARVDIIGACGSPDEGFRIANPEITDENLINFDISAGSFYLGGLLLDMEELETFRTQKDFLLQRSNRTRAPVSPRFDLVYLLAWQQPVSAVEDSELFEVALGGPDTSMRLRNMRQVRIHRDIGTNDCVAAWEKRVDIGRNRVSLGEVNEEHESISDTRLTVSYIEPENGDDLCTPSVTGGYQYAENQAIRVQLVDSNHFTWGYDNAAPLYRVQVSEDGYTVTLLTDLKDEAHWPLSGQIVEILPRVAELPNGEKLARMWGQLSTVASSYNPEEKTFTLTDPLPGDFGEEWTSDGGSRYFFMRVWNRGSDLSSAPKIHFSPDSPVVPVPLGQTGLQITITGTDQVPGDYWIIAARPETPNKVVPWELEEGMAPHGVRRFFAPLAIIQWEINEDGDIEGEVVHDCRKRFSPLTDQQTCCTCTVGDGVHSHGDFDSIEDAVNSLSPSLGGNICLLPGYYRAKVAITGKSNITIKGCGLQSMIFPALEGGDIFHISDSSYITLENMTLLKPGGTAIHVENCNQIAIENNHIMAYKHAIYVNQINEGINVNIRICKNTIYMVDRNGGDVTVFLHADNSLIKQNSVIVIPAGSVAPETYTSEWDSNGDLASDCIEEPDSQPISVVRGYFFASLESEGVSNREQPFRAHGGIQIASGSETIQIFKNKINGGAGNGITLGSYLRPEEVAPDWGVGELAKYILSRLESIFGVSIDGNTISNMGFSGIGTPQLNLLITPSLKSFKILSGLIKTFGVLSGFVYDLSIHRNHIFNCLQNVFNSQNIYGQLMPGLLKMRGEGGISLGLCENLSICENRIEENGRNHLDPVCGIFITYAGQSEINHNRIHNNGPLDTDAGPVLQPGIRGGVVLRLATSISGLTQILQPLSGDEDPIERAVQTSAAIGGYAARIHDNIVRQPVGQALRIISLGPVTVLKNRFNVDVPKFAPLPLHILDKLAGAVFVKNLAGAPYQQTDNPKIVNSAANQIFRLFNGNILFSDNQTQLGLTVFNVSSQLIVTKDDLGFDNNQSDVLVSKTGDFRFNTILLAATLRASNNRLKERIM